MNPQTTAEPGQTATLAGKHLTFALGDRSYGIPVLQVREIIKLTPITAVPQMPAHVKGVINLRGKIIPVVDLRLRFGFDEINNTEHTCIIVVQVQSANGKPVQMGVVVDNVEEVLNISESDIEPTPHFGAGIAVNFIVAMAKIKGAVKSLLNIDRILGGDDPTQTQPIAAM